mgnify:CR=1 FL=1
MQRIHAADTVPVLPEAPKDGTPGYFSDGNAATGDMATVIDAAWCNGVQEELMAFLTAAGIEPSAEDLGQVLASVKKITNEAIKKYAAPIKHASGENTYGLGSSASYGHLKLSDATDASNLTVNGGTAATPRAVAETMRVAGEAAEAADNAQAAADGAQNSANQAQSAADAAAKAAEKAAQAVTQLEENITLQLESMNAREYWTLMDEPVDADELLGIRNMYYLTEQASGSTNMPEGMAYPAFFSSGATRDGNVAIQLILSGNELYIRQGVTDDSGESWLGLEWEQFTPPSSDKPKAAGTAAAGTSKKYARGDHVHPLQTSVSGNAGTATKLATERSIDGVDFDGSSSIAHFAECSTAAGTAAKTVTVTGFRLAAGARVTVRFTVTNTAASPTLNVSGTGAKAIQYRNAAVSAGVLAANRVYEFVYDGSAWELVGDIDTNTTYAAATAAPKAAGTAAAGTSAKYAREDHVHPLQTSVTGSSGSCTGNAATATKASQDANGNVITATYATKAELEDLEGQFGGVAVLPSGTTPKAAGTASVGSENRYARGDHVHPLQTSVSGNAGTATKLATARSFRVNLASTSAVSFNGSANATPGVTGILPIANGGTGSSTGNAPSATKATQDGAGNVITETYATKEELDSKGTSMPVGSVYVQFSGQAAPNTLFGGTWSNISSSFAGLFFRAEGGLAAAFGETQQDGAPDITGALGAGTNHSGTGAFKNLGTLLQNQGSGNYSTITNWNFYASRSSSRYGSSDEVRPVNATIRIWKRTA